MRVFVNFVIKNAVFIVKKHLLPQNPKKISRFLKRQGTAVFFIENALLVINNSKLI